MKILHRVMFVFMMPYILNAYDITKSYNNLRFASEYLDNSTSVIVFDTNRDYLGRYVNLIDISNNQKLKNIILRIGVEASRNELSERANNTFEAIKFAHNDVDSMIKKMNVMKNILDVANQYTKTGVEASEAIVNAWIDEINLVVCDNQKKNNFCKIINSHSFVYVKDILNAVAKEKLKYFFIEKGTQLSIPLNITKMQVLQAEFAVILKGVGNALWLGDVLNNIIGTIAIKYKVIRLHEIGFMLDDFSKAYILGFDQDIGKLKDWILKEAKKQGYRLPSNVKLDEGKLVSFAHIFFHYIMLRKTTDAGKYNFIQKRYYEYSSQTNVKDVDMHAMPIAANIMMDRIQKFGNGGNLKVAISKDFQNFNLYSMNPLYVLPKNDKGETLCSIFNNKSTTYFNDCHFSKIVGQCSLAKEKIGKLKKYNVNNEIENSKYILSKIQATIKCNYTMKFPLVDESMEEKIEINDLFIQHHTFPDLNPNFWAVSGISKLYKKGFIRGYADGEFKPKKYVTIGQFLKMITKGAYWETDKIKIGNISKTNNIDFSNYANFLIETKKIDIGFTKNNYKEKLSKKATRGEIAKIIAGILANKDSSVKKEKLSCTNTSGDWDTCSDLLNSKCIARGDKEGSFNPTTNITRDEVSVMVVRTMNFLAGKTITCKDRHGKDVK